MLRNLLAQSGLRDTTQGGNVKIMQVENPDIKGLFELEQLDMALVPEPWGSILVEECQAEIVLDEKALWRNGNYPTALIIGRKEFILAHPELTAAFLRAHRGSTGLLAENPVQARAWINGQIREATGKAISDKVLQHALSRIQFTDKIDKAAILEFSQIMQRLEIIPSDCQLDQMIIDDNFADLPNE